MTQETDRLKTMAKNAPDQVAKIESSIASVESTIEDITKEKDAIQDGVCGNSKTEAIDIIENTIFPDKQTDPGDYVDYGPTFGVIQWDPLGNLTDWAIKDSTGNEIYSYTPGDYIDLDDLVADYTFGNDYLTRPPTTGASYGLIPKISSLTNAANLLNENADKVADSQAVFSKYAT
jgi:hypothetical protein